MRTIRSRDKSGRDAYYDAEYLRRLDAEQGRRQLNAAEVEAMIAMSVARQLADHDRTLSVRLPGRRQCGESSK